MVLVSYDVSTIDKRGQTRLRKVAKICLNYGQRVQNSVFECNVDPVQWTFFRQQLESVYNPEQDSLRFYYLGSNWQKRVEHLGTKKVPNLEDVLLI